MSFIDVQPKINILGTQKLKGEILKKICIIVFSIIFLVCIAKSIFASEENDSFSNSNEDSILMRKFIESMKKDIIVDDLLEIEKCNHDGCRGCTLNCEDKK